MKPQNIEKKWQKHWQDTNLYSFDKSNAKNKFYLLEMFSYPSGSTLHIGHWFNYSLSDSYGRFKSMQGYNVFHPVGFDSFGLPAENYALQTGIHPSVSTKQNIDKMKHQLSRIGTTFDWDYYLSTSDPSYYKWTQWLFTKLFEHGLAYQKHATVNWCTSCKTVLANEQVINSECERCSNQVIKKEMTQWFFKITAYAQRLLDDLDRLDWPEKTKTAQRNWIGRSEGVEIDFALEGGEKITVFTSRIDTLFGVSFLAVAPEHPLVKNITTKQQQTSVEKYVENALKKDEVTRQSLAEEKTGVFTGSYATSPITNKKVPIFVADYVLGNYATGAVMGVAAHDERDFDFAKKYNLEILQVIKNPQQETTLPYTDEGVLINSGSYNNTQSQQARELLANELEKTKNGRKKVNFRLRDWSVSRQRYWGAPIPIIYDKDGKPHAVPEKDLPVTLPEISDYRPQGTSPLGQNKDFINTLVPGTNEEGIRDTDTLDTFNCSSWYFLRHPSANLDEAIFDKDLTNQLLPVDKYVGGMEHATGHLLYARFITKFLYDIGEINFDEPFKSLIHQGMILGSDGQKISKSKGNSFDINAFVEKYGSDALRLYLAFGFNFIDGGPWSDSGIKNMNRFLERVERIVNAYSPSNISNNNTRSFDIENDKITNEDLAKQQEDLFAQIAELEYVLNNSIKEAQASYEDFSFNLVVARIMELVNAIYKYDMQQFIHLPTITSAIEKLLLILAPLAPHHSEEMWQTFGKPYSIHKQAFPKFNQEKLQKQNTEIAVQINSRIVDRIMVETDSSQNQALESVKTSAKVSKLLDGKTIVKTIYVPNRLINIIVK